MRGRQVQRRLPLDEVEQLVAEYQAATACKSSPGAGACIGQPWQRICGALALQLGIAAPRLRNWAKPNGSTVKSGHVSGWPSATDVMTRRCGSAKATQSAGAETVGTNLNNFWDNLSQGVTTSYILGD
jgi:hypothetical protein